MQGVGFRNKQPDGIMENNEVDLLVYGNRGEKEDGTLSSYAGGLGVEGPVTAISGSVVAFDNGGYDINIKSADNCSINAYHPDNQNQPVLNLGSNANTVLVIGFNCSDTLTEWCRYTYCADTTLQLPRHMDLEYCGGEQTVC